MLKRKLLTLTKVICQRVKLEIKWHADLARQNLIAAREAGDYSKEEEAQTGTYKIRS